MPFTAISFIGVFSDSVKTKLAPNDYVEMVQDFIVGGGDDNGSLRFTGLTS